MDEAALLAACTQLIGRTGAVARWPALSRHGSEPSVPGSGRERCAECDGTVTHQERQGGILVSHSSGPIVGADRSLSRPTSGFATLAYPRLLTSAGLPPKSASRQVH
jgi:hypothetical protein